MSDWKVLKSVFRKTYNIISDDFTHDISLEVSGDFVDDKQYIEATESICEKLNTIQQQADEIDNHKKHQFEQAKRINKLEQDLSDKTDEIRSLRRLILKQLLRPP